jgi:hypothetical protein
MKVFVPKPVTRETTHEFLAGIVRQDAFIALGPHETDTRTKAQAPTGSAPRRLLR